MDTGLKLLVAATCIVVIGAAIYLVQPHKMTPEEEMRAIDQRIIERHQAFDALMKD